MTPVDDPSVADEASLWRRIPPWHFVSDANLGKWRPSSAAFDNDSDDQPMSVLLGDEILAAGRGAASTLGGHTNFALAAITAGLARICGQGIARDPVPDEPAHALIIGDKPRSVTRRLAKAAAWVIPPPQA